MKHLVFVGSRALAFAVALALSACGGGGDDGSGSGSGGQSNLPVAISGRLVDGLGAPVQAGVSLAGATTAATQSSSDGEWQLSVPPGAYVLTISRGSEVLRTDPVTVTGVRDLGDLAVLATFRATVLGGFGQPLVGAVLAIATTPETRLVTAADGSATAQLPAGPRSLRISQNNVPLRDQAFVMTLGQVTDLGGVQALTLVEGLLIGATGTPRSGLTVSLDDPTQFIGQSDAQGRFRAEVPEGSYLLSVRRGSTLLRDLPVTVARPGPVQLGAIPVLGAITGRIFDGLLQPLGSAAVRIDTTPPTIAFAEPDGRFAVEVPRGNYLVEVLVQGAPTATRIISVPDFTAEDLGVIQALVRVFGRVVQSGSGLPVAGAEVSVDSAPPAFTTTAANGTFALDVPVHRTSQLVVRNSGLVVASTPIIPTAGTGVLVLADIAVDPAADSDGDGLSDALEVLGYEILVNFDGLATPSRVLVSSSPNAMDTDGDTLTDAQELQNRTDPSRADTDGDGLSDAIELSRYRSNPAHVDSDGDSVPAGAAPGRLPDPLLFDGNEITLSRTSPILADTDGDGLDDGTEVTGGGFRPLIADVPSIALEIIGDPIVTLNATFNGMSGQEVVNSSLERDTNSTTDVDTSINRTTSEMTTSIGGSAGATAAPPGASLDVNASVEWKEGVMSEQSSTFTRASVREVQNELRTTLSQTQSITYDSAELAVAVRVRNTSQLSFLLRDMDIVAFRSAGGGAGALQVIGSLGGQQFSGGNSFLLPPGGTTTFTALNDNLNWQAVLPFVENPTGLSFQVGSFEMLRTDLQGNVTGDYSVIAQNTVERCGLVVIDFGGGNIERYWVATNVERNPDGSGAGITMSRALEMIGFAPSDFETAPQQRQTPGGVVTGARVLTRLRTTESLRFNSMGQPISIATLDPNAVTRSWWVVLAPDANDASGNPYDFEDLPLRAGQRISLVYYSDLDGDGLLANEEALYGTRDDRADSDADGLSDFYEVRTGWEVAYVGDNCLNAVNRNVVLRQQVFSNPALADTDEDGLNDAEESPLGTPAPVWPTDPVRRDSDGDLILDAFDACPVNDPATVSPNLLEQGLVVRFLADRNTIQPTGSGFGQAATMQDLSANGNNGRISNYRQVAYNPSSISTPQDTALYETTDRFNVVGRALYFASQNLNGSSNFPQSALTVANTMNPATRTVREISLSFSMAFWVNPGPNQGRAQMRPLGIHDWAGFELDMQRRLSFSVPNPTSGQPDFRVADATPLPQDTWTFVCVTVAYDEAIGRTTMQLWRDGVVVADNPGAGTVGRVQVNIPFVNTSLGYVECGGVVDDDDPTLAGLQAVIRSSDTAFIGALDDIRIYERALEPLVVQALYFENGYFPTPVADFSFDPIAPQAAPVTINFTDDSLGQINRWTWNFGDPNATPGVNPNTSSLQNPQHLYNAAGSYVVTLTVEGPGGVSTVSRTVTVN